MVLNYLIFILIGLFTGYIWGYKEGKKKGEAIGRAHTPLILLQKSFEKGYCILCKEKYSNSGRNSVSDIELKSNSKK